MPGSVNGPALGAVFVGSVFVYSGLKDKSITASFQSLVQGKSPATAKSVPSSGGPGGSGGGTVQSGGSVQSILQKTAAQFGWGSGAEWQALQSVEIAEAGYNPTAENPSGAYGIAQSLGHPFRGGPASNGVNEYGGYGLSPAQSKAASEGQPGPQALWMCNYIKAQWGDPEAAWANEQAYHWY